MTLDLDRQVVIDLTDLLTVWSTPYIDLVSDWRQREARRLLQALNDAIAEAHTSGGDKEA